MRIHGGNSDRKTSPLRLRTQDGSTLIMTLIFLGVVSTVSVYLLEGISKNLMEEQTLLSIERFQMLVNEASLVLHENESCWLSLGSPPGASANNLTLFYSAPGPLTSPPSPLVVGPPFASSILNFRGFRINSIDLVSPTTPRLATPAFRVFLGSLNLTATMPRWPQGIVRSIPLYVTQVISPVAGWHCKSTKMIDPTQTIEDRNCQETAGMSRYNPHLKECY